MLIIYILVNTILELKKCGFSADMKSISQFSYGKSKNYFYQMDQKKIIKMSCF